MCDYCDSVCGERASLGHFAIAGLPHPRCVAPIGTVCSNAFRCSAARQCKGYSAGEKATWCDVMSNRCMIDCFISWERAHVHSRAMQCTKHTAGKCVFVRMLIVRFVFKDLHRFTRLTATVQRRHMFCIGLSSRRGRHSNALRCALSLTCFSFSFVERAIDQPGTYSSTASGKTQRPDPRESTSRSRDNAATHHGNCHCKNYHDVP